MIPQAKFGRTGHTSSRIIFGGYALSEATQDEADRVLQILLEYGINHIDTAALYGKAEECIGRWMAHHRQDFFLATKTRSRTYEGAWKNLLRSLERLQVDEIDLWQMHGLTGAAGWERAMEGTLQAFIEARDQGLVRFLGVTGHGVKAPVMHKQSLEHFDFDSVMLAHNFSLMQNPRYAAEFMELAELCQDRQVGLQTIKSISRRKWGDQPKTHNTYFYQPIEDQGAIDKAVHWALGLPESFVITAGDMQILPKMLDAASRYETRPTDAEMNALVDQLGLRPIFS